MVTAVSLIPNAAAATLKYTEQMEQAPTKIVYLKGEEPEKAPVEENTQGLGFYGVAKTVKQNNLVIKSARSQASGVANLSLNSQITDMRLSYYDTEYSTDLSIATANRRLAELEEQRKAAEAKGDEEAVKSIVEQMSAKSAELAVLQASNYAAKQGLSGLDDTIESLQRNADDQAYIAIKGVENTENMLMSMAETAYLGINAIDAQLVTLDRNLAAIDRNTAVLEKQLEIGMGSQLNLDNLRQSRSELVSTIESMKMTRKNTMKQLALLCGYDNDTELEIYGSPTVTRAELEAMNYEKDLETARKNSYSIWSAQSNVRIASNALDDDTVSTFDQYESAKTSLENAERSMEDGFRVLYEAVKDKERLAKEAETAFESEDRNFKADAVRYQQGMLSQNAWLSAKDELEAKRDSMTTANRDLFQAYNNYAWALKGYMSSTGA